MRYTQEEIAYIWFDSFFDANSALKFKILEEAGDALNFALNIDKFSDLLIKSGKDGVYNTINASLTDNVYTKKLVRELEENKIIAVTKASENYPVELSEISAAPVVLYCKGNISLLKNKKFAVVGSRRTLPAVLKQTEKFAEELSKYFTVVTGIADGGDSAALKGALKNKNAICVLPCGHGQIYPASGRNLCEETAKNSLVISAYKYDCKAQKFTFAERNRIIASLAKGVLAVSAGEKSGVLSTAYKAADLGKDVFAFPYGMGVESGVGCNALIKKGAFLCDNIVDILSCFGIDFKIEESPKLSEDEEKVLSFIRGKQNVHVEEIAEKLNADVVSLSSVLLMLEMDGLIVRTGGNRYSAV